MLAHQGDYTADVITLLPEVQINYSDWSISSENVTITASSCANVCYLNQIANGKIAMASKFVEFGRWVLDGTHALPPDNQDDANFTEIGWWSHNLSNGSSVFSPAEWVNTNYIPRVVTSYTVAFDDKGMEYAVDFKVELFNGATLLLTDTVTNNTSVLLTRDVARTIDVTDIKLTITKWSHANRHVKVTEITTAVIENYDISTLLNFDVTEEREVSNSNSAPTGNIATNTMNLSLVNVDRQFDNNNPTSRLKNLIRPYCKITAFIGAKLPDGGFDKIPVFSGYTKNWNVPDGSLEVSVSAVDMIDVLTRTQYKKTDIQLNQTFSWWIERVLNDAGLSANQYIIDATLNGALYTIPVGYFKSVKSHKNALQDLTRGCGAVAYQDRNGLIRVQSITNLSGTSQQTYDRSNYITKDNQPAFDSMANVVTVETSPLILGTSKNVYSGNTNDPFTIGASSSATFTIKFNSSPCSNVALSVGTGTGVSIDLPNSNIYTWGADVRITNSTGSPQNFTLSATGQQYEISGENIVSSRDEASIEQNGAKELDWGTSFWIQKVGLGQVICDNIVASFKDPSKDVSISLCCGNPALELGDRFTVTDLYESIQYYATKLQMQYSDGGFQTSLEGRK